MSRAWSRTILALRAGGVLLLALGIDEPLAAIADWATDPDVWIVAGVDAHPAAGRLSIIGAAAQQAAPLSWILRHGSSVLAMAGGAYLLLRPAPKLIRLQRSTP